MPEPIYTLTYPNAYQIGDLAHVLGPGYRNNLPVWYVADPSRKGKPERVEIRRIRGPLDRESSGTDWAELADGRVVPTLYLFPARGFSKPRFVAIQDEYGIVHNWVSFARGYTPRPIEPASLGAARRGAALPRGASFQAQRYIWDLGKPGTMTMIGPTPRDRYFLLKRTGKDLYFLGEVDIFQQPVSEYGRQGTAAQIGPDIDYVLAYGRLPI